MKLITSSTENIYNDFISKVYVADEDFRFDEQEYIVTSKFLKHGDINTIAREKFDLRDCTNERNINIENTMNYDNIRGNKGLMTICNLKTISVISSQTKMDPLLKSISKDVNRIKEYMDQLNIDQNIEITLSQFKQNYVILLLHIETYRRTI